MTSETPPSFSPARKWSLSVNTLVLFVTMLALLLMVNYLAARHFQRWSCSGNAQAQLSPLTLRVLNSVTNPVKVTLYFDKRDPLYGMSYNLLKAYRFASSHIQIEVVDYLDEPGAAQLVKSNYKLGDTDRDIVIFSTQGRQRVVYQSELSDLDLQPLVSGQSREVKRTHFKGEAMFTSAILNVLQSRQPKAYFLEGHNEHNPAADDGDLGYSRFAGVLKENNVSFETLRLEGPGEIPTDCNLLIVAGPNSAMQPDVLDKISRYLKQGGRLLALFNYNSLLRLTGLEATLADWGIAIGQNVVIDEKTHDSQDKNNMITSAFGTHPLIKPLYGYQLYLVLPRAVDKDRRRTVGSDAPQVDPLVFSSAGGRVITDIRRDGTIRGSVTDLRGNVSVMVAVEKGGIRNVSTDRGTTRLVVTGDSFFLNNNNIDREANRPFASHAINWLLARNELLVGVPRRPIKEFKLTLTAPEMSAVQWILMGAMPGVALLLGGLVWLRRRR
jgi:hypothetical protein